MGLDGTRWQMRGAGHRFHALVMAALSLGIIVTVAAARHAPSSRNALASALAPFARQLARQEDIHLRALHAGTTVRVSESAAKGIALREFLKSPATNVSAFAVSETNDAYGKRQRDGTLRLEIVDRPVWVVLIPSWRIPRHPSSESNATAMTTLAVFVDANAGKFLEAVTLAR